MKDPKTTIDEVYRSMTNVKPTEEQIRMIEGLRTHYKDLVRFIAINLNDSRYTNIAIQKLEESLMWGVKSLVLEKKEN